jgi:CSLREA domain-containing protein
MYSSGHIFTIKMDIIKKIWEENQMAGKNISKSIIFTSIILSVVIYLFMSITDVNAAHLSVDTLSDELDGSCVDGDCSLRDAIQVAASGDTITFSVTGSIILNMGQLTTDKHLTINGPGPGNLTLDGNHTSRILWILESGQIDISNMTIANGYGYSSLGGAIYNQGNASFTNVIFNNNHGSLGGAICNGSSRSIDLTFVTFSGNSAGNEGGSLWNNGYARLINVNFNGNSAPYGGGINNSSMATLTNVTFNGNSATNHGGGMVNYGTATLTNVTFSGNSSTNLGGGIAEEGSSTLSNVTFNGNVANNGGGIYVWSGSTSRLKNTLLAGGNAPTGKDCSGTVNSYGYNLIQETAGCTITGDQTGNVYGEDPLLGPLAQYSGYTFTHALLPGSPAIDSAASTDPDGNPVTVDQRGVARPQGPSNDIGAYEYVYEISFWLPLLLK